MNEKLKILVAEDELLIAMDLKQKVEEMGHEVTSLVSTAIEAITKCESDKPDIILMDIRLSGSLNGVDAAKIIIYKHKIPIIFLTSNSSEVELLKDNDFKDFNYLSKPVDNKNLQKILQNNIDMMMLS